MIEDNNLVALENILAYMEIYKIEIGLRELLITKLGKVDYDWWKHRLPADVLEKYREGRREERKIKWIELVPHHPIYYIDFTDLRKIIERNDNWKDVFQEIFSDKEVICGMLRDIEPLRNKVAHNRKVSGHDLQNVRTVYQLISTSVGDLAFEDLIRNCSVADDIPTKIHALKQEAIKFGLLCKAIKPFDRLEIWEQVKQCWWFDGEYLGNSVEGIKGYFKLLVQYKNLPRFKGSGYRIEEWVSSNNIDQNYNIALIELDKILESL